MAVKLPDDWLSGGRRSSVIPVPEFQQEYHVYPTEYIYARLMNYIDNHVQNGTNSCDKTELRKFYHSYFGEINRDNGSNVDTFMLDLVTHGIGAYYKEKSFSSGDKT